MGKEKISMGDLYTITSYLYKYRTMSPKKAMKELLKVDIVRNRYTKDSLYTTLTRVGLYTRTKQPVKGLGKAIMNILDELMAREKYDVPKYTERVEPVKAKTTEELLEELRKRKEEIKHIYLKESHKIKIAIEELNEKLEIIENVCIEEEEKINSKIKDITRMIVKQKLGIEGEV